jgi:hypothetical protein
MAHTKTILQCLVLLVLVTLASTSVAYGAEDVCTVNLTIEPYLRVEIQQDTIKMSTVTAQWFRLGIPLESTGSTEVYAWTNVPARLRCPLTVNLYMPNDNDIEVSANVNFVGDNQYRYLYEDPFGVWWYAMNLAPGHYDNGGHATLNVSTGNIRWLPAEHHAGTYVGTITVTIEPR